MGHPRETSSWSTTALHPDKHSLIVSSDCVSALSDLVEDDVALALATEASSHPSGVISVYNQPYVYAGGGLGNYYECPLQTCLAGRITRGSMIFASACVPFECTAEDVHSTDYLANLESTTSGRGSIAEEYYRLQKEIRELNNLFRTGWSCGKYVVPTMWGWLMLYSLLTGTIIVLSIRGMRQARNKGRSTANDSDEMSTDCESFQNDEEEKKEIFKPVFTEEEPLKGRIQKPDAQETEEESVFRKLLSAWDISEHYSKIFIQRKDTACLDGVRVGSILWIIFGHLMAITASTGAGYSNPGALLPPNGVTSTFAGQLLFASRFAVDSFLVISGYLVVRVLNQIPMNIPATDVQPTWFVRTYFKRIPGLLLLRIVRILPLYALTLGFFILVAPHLGGGPFWYQWQGLLLPCVKYGWTNFLFVNNFFPTDLSITETCFYHSWYLAVDVQLFIVAPLLIFCYRQSQKRGVLLTAVLTLICILFTIYLTYTRQWSINTYDGAAVGRFDKEGYAKPHIRAQAYLMGMLLAMCLPLTEKQTTTTWKQKLAMALALLTLFTMTFITVTGVYSRRACEFYETPFSDDADCGSTWSPQMTFLYAATARSLWSLSVAVLLGLCLNGHGGIIGNILEWKIWTPLSHLTFGAYLIHPIVIFVWQLADTQKENLSVLGTVMDYLSVSVGSFASALALSLLVEMPCSRLIKVFIRRDVLARRKSEEAGLQEGVQVKEGNVDRQGLALLKMKPDNSMDFNEYQQLYGSTGSRRKVRM